MDEPIWVLKAVVLALHGMLIAEHGGRAGLRDEALLDSALGRPRNLFAYGDPRPDLCAPAASYAYGIAKTHPFFDGNKRTSLVVSEAFLELNRLTVIAGEVEKVTVWLSLADGTLAEPQLQDWFQKHTRSL